MGVVNLNVEKTELISIIVPVYNSQQYLDQCLISLIHQTYQNIQIICVDDSSTDNSYSVLREYSERDNRIEIYRKSNEGVSEARNFGLDKALGKYVMFVDSDDWLELQTCEKVMQFCEYDLVMWPYIRELGNIQKKKEIFNQNKEYKADQVRKDLYRKMIGPIGKELKHPENMDSLCTVWGKLYRLDIIRFNDIRFEDIRNIGSYEDGLFNLKYMFFAENAIYINSYFYHYRRTNSNSLTNQYNPDLSTKWNNLFSILRKNIDCYHTLDRNMYMVALKNRITLSLIALGINILLKDGSGREKRKMIKELISTDQYEESIKDFPIKYLAPHWKIFFLCAKYKCIIGIYVLLIVIQKIRRK